MNKEKLIEYYNTAALDRLIWKRRNKYYYYLLEKYIKFIIPKQSKVLELGCGTGELLNAVEPVIGVGVDFSTKMLDIAKDEFKHLKFINEDVENFTLEEKFDYVIMSDLVGNLIDVQEAFRNLKKVCHNRTRIIITYYNFLWEPVLRFGEKIGLKKRQPIQNWLSSNDIIALLKLAGFETIKKDKKILLPVNIPILNTIFNKFFANLPLFNLLNLTKIIVARHISEENKDFTVSILIPARNEKGNIENAILRIPPFGKSQEILYVEGNSSDGTYEEMLRVKEKYTDKKIIVTRQSGKGKGNAVREGFDIASGEILMILDADLTTPPEDLPKFYEALKQNNGEFINGCRLVYPMEKQAMRFLNLIANKLFGIFFSYLLGQKLKDTLCGTKVLFKKDYEIIKQNRSYFGDFDPFGDFDLLFGAAKLNMSIVEIPVRYKDRTYGTTQISRFKHGWLLVLMTLFAARKLKFY